jgi:hypothetical protein
VNLFFFDRPLLHRLPDRFDIVIFSDVDGRERLGIVIGLPHESVEVIDGLVAVDGYPQLEPPGWERFLNGDVPLVAAGPYATLIATIRLSSIDAVYEVDLPDIVGKVEPFL